MQKEPEARDGSQPLALVSSAVLGPLVEAVGMVNYLDHGAASCVHSEGCHGVTQSDLEKFSALLLKSAFAAVREAEALAMDAEMKAMRYLWLRDNASAEWRPIALRNGCTGRKADALVDAAMKSGPNVGREAATTAEKL